MSRPLVSVVIAVKNGERYLADAIESILEQTYDRLEIIVVDGRSTDRSREIASSYAGVRCISQVGEGFADAWNLGIEAARGPLIGFLDSDDRWLPTKLEQQVRVTLERPEVDYVITRMRFVLEEGLPHPPGFDPELLGVDHPAYMPSALLVRSTVFERIGRFGTHWKIASDTDWFARAKDHGLTLGLVPEVLLHKRVHDANLSYFAAQNLNREIVRLLRESVARNRRDA